MMRHAWILCLMILPFIATSCSPATPADSAPVVTPSIEHVEDFMDHGMTDHAMAVAINILHHPGTTDHVRAEALYHMGRIAFDLSNYEQSMKDWQRLTEEYPRSERTAEVTHRIAQLYQAARARSEQ